MIEYNTLFRGSFDVDLGLVIVVFSDRFSIKCIRLIITIILLIAFIIN